MTRAWHLRVAAVATGLVVLNGCASSGEPEAGPSEAPDAFAPSSGGRLPDTRLDALSGAGSLELREVRGPAVVNVWASWCGPCRTELPLYEEFSQAHGDVVDVVGIASEDASDADARELVSETGVTYPNFTDPDGDLRAIALPKVVLVDASGEIAFEQYLEITDVGQLEDLAREHLGVDLG